ncbi:glycosyltransferase [Empedobacter brevis]|uniref:glycosyltransferase n=1 Tax=Empedobacter brevis TaxID=247 RepID=UPI00123CBE49|nr:glycosyltransferase [Empedobacter brevis]QES92011.1 glycosyltransferase [Empedobacter brevis]
MNKISLIIPIYNGESHIKECYQSISNQSIKSLEIIFVNDGSTDKSLEILNNLKKNDSRIILIDQENKGVSVARNEGIKIATSEYVGFMDVDDYIYPEYYSTLLENIKDNDIIISNLLLEKDNTLKQNNSSFSYEKVFYKDEIENQIMQRLLCIEDLTLLSCCNKLYKRSFLIDNNIFFLKNLSLEEDGIFNCLAFSKCNTLTFINYAGYIYKENENSVTRDFIKNKIFEKNIIKYNFKYKKYIKLGFSDSDISKFKSSRLIFSVSFLIFSMMKNKHVKLRNKVNYIYSILTNVDVITANSNLHELYLDKQTIFEKYISYLINHPNKAILTLNTIIFNLLNFKPIISFFRVINNKKL